VTELQNLTLLGVNATADAANKLTVSSAGVLLTHAGTDQRLKLNKNAAGDTASIVLQDNFSGRAEIGLTGDDDLHVKVSANGAAWTEALTINRTTGQVSLPQGLGSNSVPNAALADMATARLKGRTAAGTGDPEDLTGTQATALLDTFTSAAKGLAPASGGSTTDFLRADGTWAAPPGGGEANTASNVNAGGVGVFKQKTGVNLEMRGLNAASNKVSVTLDAANNEIDIDVAEGNLTLANLAGAIDLGSAKASGTLAAARFPSLAGDVTTTAGSLATAIADDAVTNAKAANMATATIKGRTSAGTGDPEDLTGTQATALLDTFTSAAKGLAPASGGGTTNFLRADGTWAAPAGGGGGSGDVIGPASATDNAVARFDAATGKLIQNSAVTIDDKGAITMPVIATPAAPAADRLSIFAANRGGRLLPKSFGPAGLDTVLQPNIFGNSIGWFRPVGNSTTISLMGLNNTASGTATSRTVATTSLLASTRRAGFVSAATAGSSAGTRHGSGQFWRGNAAGLGGFFFVARFGMSDAAAVAGARSFIGLSATAGVLSNADPSTNTNIVGVGHDGADSNLSIIHNDGTGTATKVALGANFLANTLSADLYELALFAAPNGADVGYRVERLNTGDVASGTLTTDLPANTALLSPQLWRNNGATALAVGIDVVSQYIETDF
jgi:hypothetical protein